MQYSGLMKIKNAWWQCIVLYILVGPKNAWLGMFWNMSHSPFHGSIRKPDLFLTMTASGSWPEISQNLLPGLFFLCMYLTMSNHHIGQSEVDRPDLVTRVFHAKQQALLNIICDGYYGQVAGFVYTIEYQKCGLPHMDLLIFLEEPDKIRDVDQIDTIISAQIPDPQIHPQLHAAINKFMLHGPCSPQRFIENNVCKKCFPKFFTPYTIIKADGYPDYAHHYNGRTEGMMENTTFEHNATYRYRLLYIMEDHWMSTTVSSLPWSWQNTSFPCVCEEGISKEVFWMMCLYSHTWKRSKRLSTAQCFWTCMWSLRRT